MRTIIAASLALTLITAGGIWAQQPRREDPGIAADKAQIRKSLSTMERMPREAVQARLHMVAEEGISSLDSDGSEPKVGELAPDFSLTPLKFYEFEIDATEITRENADLLYDKVRLSDFRGKKNVVLIFGSYT